MNQIFFTNQEISELICRELLRRHWSVRKCCEEFNIVYRTEINKNKQAALDKDFVQRIKKGKFKVLSDRVLGLCSFLKLDLSKHPSKLVTSFNTETQLLERVLLKKPYLTTSMRSILENLLTVAEGEHNEVR